MQTLLEQKRHLLLQAASAPQPKVVARGGGEAWTLSCQPCVAPAGTVYSSLSLCHSHRLGVLLLEVSPDLRLLAQRLTCPKLNNPSLIVNTGRQLELALALSGSNLVLGDAMC